MQVILVPIDFSDSTSAVVAEATEMARALNAKIYLLHVVPPETHATTTELGPVVVRERAGNGIAPRPSLAARDGEPVEAGRFGREDDPPGRGPGRQDHL